MTLGIISRSLLIAATMYGLTTETTLSAVNNPIEQFKQSWIAHALALQREIDLKTPLNEATFIGTHNSYNSKSYQIPLVRYVDPNQTLSIYDQLEMGVRSIELDTHWTLASVNHHLENAILLCHGQANNAGCGVYDRKISEGLEEIRAWLNANPNEVLLIYIERFLKGHEPRLAHELKAYLGNYIYMPSAIRDNHHPTGCFALPSTLTKAAILNSGKQIVMITKGCDTNTNHPEQDQFKLNLNDYVFAGSGNIPGYAFNFIDATVNKFPGFPDCGRAVFANDVLHTSLWRIFEDRTILSNMGHPQKKLLPIDMEELMHCGINWPTMDMLTINDERLSAAIWSWAPTYPQEGHGQCTIYKYNEGIKNVPCDETRFGFACYEKQTHAMRAIALQSSWSNAEANCQKVAGANWRFVMPVNGKQMQLLREAMHASSLLEVWLNYKNQDGHWIANG